MSALLVLVFVTLVVSGSNPHRLGVGLISTADGWTPVVTLNQVLNNLQVRQYGLLPWWSTMSNGLQSISLSVSTSLDVFELDLPENGNSCASWGTIARAAFRARGGTGTYDSYIWIFPDSSVAPGCSTVTPGGTDVFAPLGPCAGGCDNFLYGGPYINSYIFAIGRNKGLLPSHTPTANFGDFACQMGQVLQFPGSHRRGFNALKLETLGVVTAATVSPGSSSLFLSSLYNYEFDTPGITRLLRLGSTQVYLSFRSAREWTVDRSNNFGSRYMSYGNVINGATHVLKRNTDGSSVLLAVILTGQTYAVPETVFSVRQDWTTNLGAQLSISSTGVLPAAVSEPAVTYPPAATVLWNTGTQDTAEQGSQAVFSYGGSAVLNINWAGDDRNSSVFIRLRVNVPAASNIVSASLFLEADTDQLQAQQGTTQTFISAEQSLNSQTYSGNLRARPYFSRVATPLSGDYFIGDELNVDVRTQVQQVVSQANWAPGGYMNLMIYSAVLNQQLTRTAQSGYGCGLIGGATLCGPRLRIVYTSSGGGLPAPQPCVFSWSAWSVCTNANNACGSAGTQERNLLVSVPAANGGTACPTPTRETRSCTTEACVPVVKNCIWTWGSWSDCVGSCSSFGTRTRSIVITQLPDPTGVQCPTVQTESDNTCLTVACAPINCVVEYTNWSPCSGPCGSTSGTQNRTGTIRIQPQYNGAACPALFQTQSCTTNPCSQNCIVTYGEFGACVGTCGGLQGIQQKTGVVTQSQIGSGSPCPPLIVSQPCVTAQCPPRDCVYSWSYSTCEGPCGGTGTQVRTAVVLITPVGSGTPCPAPSTVSCAMPPCVAAPINSFPFAESATRGVLSSGSLLNLVAADGVAERITESGRAIDYVWLVDVPKGDSTRLNVVAGASNLAGQTILFQWSFLGGPWANALSLTQSSSQAYSVTLSPVPNEARIMYIRMTNSDQTSTRASLTSVAVDQLVVVSAAPTTSTTFGCIQGEWVAGACSTKCGTGTQTLTRPTLQQPAPGGAACGPSSATQACSEFTQCPDNCVVSSWSSYSACSAVCGSGTMTRTRTIVRPPANGGLACPSLTETIACAPLPPCSGSCVYGPWTPSGACSVACGGGTQLLTRTATGPGCSGSSTMTQPCNNQTCPGSTFSIRLQALLTQSDGGTFYQAWPSPSNVVTSSTSLILSGRATDLSPTLLANGYWQLVTRPGREALCRVTAVTLTCPSGTTVATSNIANLIGKAQCQGSLGVLSPLATIQFSIVC